MEEENLKDTPFNRLKIIMKSENEPELTKNGSSNLDNLLGVKKKKDNKIISFLKKVNSKLFPKSKITNRYHKR